MDQESSSRSTSAASDTVVCSTERECAESATQFSTDALSIPEGMSKTQWKKKLKQERKKQKWKEMKQVQKEKKKRKREEIKVLGLPVPKRIRLDRGRYKKMSDAGASPVRVALDCSFEDLMHEQDLKKLIKQIQRCFAANRRSPAPFQYYVTSYGGRMKAELNTRYPVTKEHEQWDIHYETKHFLEVFGKENVVYLLAESPNVLTELNPSKAYIIGGLVDHNHHKVGGYCFKLAQEKGLHHARLPLSEYIDLNSRKILPINHVYEILLTFATNGGDWKKAFHQIIPPRKLLSGAKKGQQKPTEQNDAAETVDQSSDESEDNGCNAGAEAPQQSQDLSDSEVQTKNVALKKQTGNTGFKEQTGSTVVENQARNSKGGTALS